MIAEKRKLFFSFLLEPDVARTITAGVPNLMSQNRTIRLTPKINIEVWVESETTFLCVHINLQQVGPVLQHVWVELLVPRGEQGICDIQPLAIQTAT